MFKHRILLLPSRYIALYIGLAVFALCATGLWLYSMGHEQGAGDLQYLIADQQRLQQKVNDLLDLKDKSERRLAISQRTQQIDKVAYGGIETELLVLQREISGLQEDLSFYRGIMAPEDARVGLRIQGFKLESGIATNYFDYQLLLVQIKRNSVLIQGVVKIQIEGEKNGLPMILDLQDVSVSSTKQHTFKFRYFQNIRGKLHLPDDFLPHSVRIQVIPSKKPESMLKWSYKWVI